MAAWIRRGETEGSKIECSPFGEKAFTANLTEIRKLTAQPARVFLPELKRLCAEAGVAIVFVLELPHCPVSGATRWISQHKALIIMTIRYKTNDHFWLTFFHEAAHILKHGKKERFINDGKDSYNAKEIEADKFASDFLINPKAYTAFLSNCGGFYSEGAIGDLAKSQGEFIGLDFFRIIRIFPVIDKTFFLTVFKDVSHFMRKSKPESDRWFYI